MPAFARNVSHPRRGGRTRSGAGNALRTCLSCRRSKTRCQLPDLTVASSATPLSDDKACRRCRSLSAPCVVDDSQRRVTKAGTSRYGLDGLLERSALADTTPSDGHNLSQPRRARRAHRAVHSPSVSQADDTASNSLSIDGSAGSIRSAADRPAMRPAKTRCSVPTCIRLRQTIRPLRIPAFAFPSRFDRVCSTCSTPISAPPCLQQRLLRAVHLLRRLAQRRSLLAPPTSPAPLHLAPLPSPLWLRQILIVELAFSRFGIRSSTGSSFSEHVSLPPLPTTSSPSHSSISTYCSFQAPAMVLRGSLHPQLCQTALRIAKALDRRSHLRERSSFTGSLKSSLAASRLRCVQSKHSSCFRSTTPRICCCDIRPKRATTPRRRCRC